MRVMTWAPAGAGRAIRSEDSAWLRGMQVQPVSGSVEGRTPAGEETLLLLLSGTLDLFAGSSSWLQRGLRDTPYSGRPCGVFLPPGIGWRAQGQGELLLVGTRKPPEPAPPAGSPPPPAMSGGLLGLLPMSGSGKAYDARTGKWEMLERFPSSPEAVLPRAIEALEVGGVRGERVFGFGFKASSSCLDEFVLAPGQTLTLPQPRDHRGQPFGTELALLVRSEGRATVQAAQSHACTGELALFGATADVRVHAVTGHTWLAATWAGAK